jgi:hypothetical protein
MVVLAALAFAASCHTGNLGLPIYPDCGGSLTGIDLNAPPGVTRLVVGHTLFMTGTVGAPRDSSPLTEECPSVTGGKSYFPRVQWTYAIDGPFDVSLVDCSCTIDYETTSQGRHVVVARTSAPSVFTFELVGRRLGNDYISLEGFVSGPCPSGSGGPALECGPSAGDGASFEVVPAE